MSPRVLTLGALVMGLGLLVVSNVMYFSRTNDKLFKRFWPGKEILTRNEYLLNRGGFWLAIAAIVLNLFRG
jgi:hypothetical protein